MNYRTDLALERSEDFKENMPSGVSCEIKRVDTAQITKISVTNESGAKALGKPIGKYYTVEVPAFTKSAPLSQAIYDATADIIREMLPDSGAVLVAGLGNVDITPDALGPKCSDLIFATRHIGSELAKNTGLGTLRPVATFAPGVLGKTGIETGELIAGGVKTVKPCAVIAVDALAARRLSRLGRTVQISDTGVVPGSGVGNSRTELSRATLGVPVISIGVPTVVDAATLAYDVSCSAHEKREKMQSEMDYPQETAQMMVTPREVDLMLEHAAQLIAMSVNRALQPHLSLEDLFMLVS